MNLLASLFQRSARNRGYNHLLQLDDRLLILLDLTKLFHSTDLGETAKAA